MGYIGTGTDQEGGRKQITTLIYSVPGVSCAHCRQAIESEVSQVRGVESVAVDLDAKTVTVSGEPLDEPAIVAAIGEGGYEVVTV